MHLLVIRETELNHVAKHERATKVRKRFAGIGGGRARPDLHLDGVHCAL